MYGPALLNLHSFTKIKNDVRKMKKRKTEERKKKEKIRKKAEEKVRNKRIKK